MPLCPADHAGVPAAHAEACNQPGETPLWPWEEYQQRVPSAGELRLLLHRVPTANLGLALGPVSGLVGVIPEPDAGTLPPTLELTAPDGGRRLLYGLPHDAVLPRLPGLRFLSTGDILPLPPARTAAGKAYAWRPGHGPDDRPAAPLPWVRPVPLAQVIRLSAVTPASVQWLWPGWIPLGAVTVLDGDPGLGKSTLLLDLAARVTTGRPMPDGAAGVRGGVVLLTAEDNLADTVGPRLHAAGADLERVHVLTAIDDAGHGPRPPAIPADLPELERVLTETDARLLVVDPFLAFLGPRVDSGKDADVRRCLHRLHDVAARAGCAAVLLRHLTKAGPGKAVYRGGGSIGIIGAARAGLLVARDPDAETDRVLACTKSNLAAAPRSLRFRLEPAEGGVCRVAWAGPVRHRADELIRRPDPPEDRDSLREAGDFLTELLAPGPQPAEDCLRRARAAGVAEKTLRRAKTRLGVASRRENQGAAGHWVWVLPAAGSPADDDPSNRE